MRQIKTVWTSDELMEQAIASVADDPNWMVQTQSAQSLVIRREKSIPVWQWLVFGAVVVCTFGFGLILFPMLFIGFKNQQIVLNAKASDGKTAATITYTSGAKGRVNTFIQSIPLA